VHIHIHNHVHNHWSPFSTMAPAPLL
jgi:hypothetical protein